MGREQRRREEKKNRNKKDIEENELLDTTIHGVTVLKVCFATILILFVLYYVLAVFITKEIDISEKSDKADTSDTSSANVSDKIIAANIPPSAGRSPPADARCPRPPGPAAKARGDAPG